MSKHVAVLMGGWSAEREVSLRSGAACADALERLGYRVTRIDVGRDIADGPDRGQARRRAQCAARPAGRGRHAARHAGNPCHPLHPFRGDGVGGRHAEGRRQGAVPGRRRAGPRRRGGLPLRGRQGPPAAAALRDQADRGGLERGRFHRARGSCPSAAGAHPRGLGLWRAGHRRKLHCRQGVDLRGHGRRGARRDRDRADGKILRL